MSNMLRNYIEQYTKGTLNPRPNVRTIRESPGTATVDCDNGLVTILGPRLMRMAMDKARRVGVGVVTVFNSGHSGAIGHHAMIAAKEDMVGVSYTAAGALAVPPFGAEVRLGTNPIAIAAPARERTLPAVRRRYHRRLRQQAEPCQEAGLTRRSRLDRGARRYRDHRGDRTPRARRVHPYASGRDTGAGLPQGLRIRSNG